MIDSRIRQLHVARYGTSDEVEGYLRTVENLVPVSDGKPGENHHMLMKSVWPEFADLKTNPWNRLRVTRAIHTALTELQSRFEERLRYVSLMMKGQSAEAQLAACSRGGRTQGRIQGRKNAESGHIARIATPESCSKGGKTTYARHPELARENGRRAAESGQLVSVATFESCSMGGKTQGRKNVESGQWDQVRVLGCSKGGKIGGRKNAESGHFARVRKIGLHTRWHINRDVINPACSLCTNAEGVAA